MREGKGAPFSSGSRKPDAAVARHIGGRPMARVVALAVAAAVGACGMLPQRRVVTIDWATPRQTIDGFGAATNETSFVEPLSESLMDFFFTENGLGFSLLRIRDYPSRADCESDSRAGVCFATPGATLLTTDLKAAQMAVARGTTVWASQWSPPGPMKANGSFMRGGEMIGTAANYAALAELLAGFVTLMAAHGVPIYAISPQNEPDISTWYPSATWTPRQIHDFVPYLHDALRSAGAMNTKIMIAEQSQWERRFSLWGDSFSYAAEAMADPDVAAKVGILAAHAYGTRLPSGRPNVRNLTSQRIWQTESSSFEDFDGGIENALAEAEKIHAFLSEARVNAFHYWYLTASDNNNDNQTLVDKRGTVALRAYAMGNWSKFVRPGWQAVSVASPRSLLTTAFQNPAGSRSVIVMVNTQSTPVSEQRIDAGAAMQGSVTPWITSGVHALAPQPPVPVTGGTFSYTIPAASIVTFVGQTGSAR